MWLHQLSVQKLWSYMVGYRSYSNLVNQFLSKSQCKFKCMNFLLLSTPLLLPANSSWHWQIIAKTVCSGLYVSGERRTVLQKTAIIHIYKLSHTWKVTWKVGWERGHFSWPLTYSPLISNQSCWQNSLGCCLRKIRKSSWVKEKMKEARISSRSIGNPVLYLKQ